MSVSARLLLAAFATALALSAAGCGSDATPNSPPGEGPPKRSVPGTADKKK